MTANLWLGIVIWLFCFNHLFYFLSILSIFVFLKCVGFAIIIRIIDLFLNWIPIALNLALSAHKRIFKRRRIISLWFLCIRKCVILFYFQFHVPLSFALLLLFFYCLFIRRKVQTFHMKNCWEKVYVKKSYDSAINWDYCVDFHSQ